MALRQQQPVIAGVLDQSATRLHQPLLQTRQQPVVDCRWQHQPPPQVPQVVGDHTQPQAHLVGIFASTGLDKAVSLRVPENGLIALNVPLDQLRLGALSTRTTHPFYIARWNELLHILGMATQIENPYWDRTKGDMVASCTNRNLLRRIIGDSMSCSSPTKGRWTGHGSEHCGFCLPCLIRRAAIRAGLGKDDPTTYTLADLTAQNLDTRRAEGRQVRSFQLAITRLKKEPRLASILIHKPGSLSSESAGKQASLADVYRRGMIEVDNLLKGVETTPD